MHAPVEHLKAIPERMRGPKTSDNSHDFSKYGMTEIEIAAYMENKKKENAA